MILKYDFDDMDFEYEVDNKEIRNALVTMLLEDSEFEDNENNRKLANYLLDQLDIDTGEWKDELKEYFREEARELFKEETEKDRDPLGYVGMSRKDFL